MTSCNEDVLKQWQNPEKLPMCNTKAFFSPTQKQDCIVGVHHAVCMLSTSKCATTNAICALLPNDLQQFYCRETMKSYQKSVKNVTE
jgi:hypothetical protein